MRRNCGIVLACGMLWLAGARSSRGQDIMIGDAVGFGRGGVSNGFGYGYRGGYLPGLYYPVDASNGPSRYYHAAFNGLNGTPTPEVASRGWGWSPPWSAAYRQGEPRTHRLLGHFHRRHEN